MSDLHTRLRWQVEHHRDELVQLLAGTVPADILRDAWAAHRENDLPDQWGADTIPNSRPGGDP